MLSRDETSESEDVMTGRNNEEKRKREGPYASILYQRNYNETLPR